MGQRTDLQQILATILGNDNVYFQPPANVQMKYPCIVYHRDFADTEFAGNQPYRYVKRYMVTVIDGDPDSTVSDEVAKLPMTTYNRFYTSDNLNHDVFNVFF